MSDIPEEHRLQIGDPVTHTIHTDANAATVIDVSPNGKTVTVRYCKQRLLNGPASGEPDAQHSSPGGFAAHVSGVQRWEVTEDPEGATRKFSYRHTGSWKAAGHPALSPGNVLRKGHHPYYDYNF